MKRRPASSQENRAAVMTASEMSEPEREQLGKHGIHHVLLLPVRGKKTVIGMLSLGCSGSRRHTQRRTGVPGNGGAETGYCG